MHRFYRFALRPAVIVAALALWPCTGSFATIQPNTGHPRAAAGARRAFATTSCSSSPCIYTTNGATIGQLAATYSVTTYPASATGNVTPLETITGNQNKLAEVSGVTVGGTGDVYVSDFAGIMNSHRGRLAVYAAGANGNARPLRRIYGPNTDVAQPTGIALDANQNIYSTNLSTKSVTVFSPQAHADATPIAVISGSNTLFSVPSGIALDASANIYVLDEGFPQSILTFAAGSNGNVKPVRAIRGSNTGMNSPDGIGLDSTGNMYVADFALQSVFVFAAGATGNVAPIRTITGSNTALQFPSGVTVDSTGKIYVSNRGGIFGGAAITVYPAGANGNMSPIQDITGSNTGLSETGSIAVH